MSRIRSLILALLVMMLQGLPIASLTADRVEARTLPTHCADLLDGDCDLPWQCIFLCFTELLDQTEYCGQHPTDPQCN